MSITLSAEQEMFIQSQIALGQYKTPSQVIDAALELLELGNAASPAHHLDASALRQQVMEGLAQAKRGDFVSQDDVGHLLHRGNNSQCR
jgi:putative addiction module CopG family antidote